MSIEVNPRGDGGGLSQVHHDGTLTGTGADSDNPLSVAIPFTQALKAKLEGLSTADADILGEAMLDVMAQGRVISDRDWVTYWNSDGSNQISISIDNSNPPFANADNFIGMYANYANSKDKGLLDSIDAGDVVLVTDAVSPTQWLVFRVAGTQYDTGMSENFIGIWFGDDDVLYKSGLNEYDSNWTTGDTARVYIVKQMLDADGTNVGAAIRAALPTGTVVSDADLSTATQLLLDTFNAVTLGEVYEHHDQFHTGATLLSGYTYKTGTVTPNAADVAVSAPLQGSQTGTYYIKPKDDDDKGLLKNILIANKRVRFQVSATRYIEFRPSGSPGELSGRLFGNFAAASYATMGAVLTNNHAISVSVQSNIAARDEVRAGAYKENPMTLLGQADQQAFSSSTWTSYSGATFDADDIIHFCVGTSAAGFAAVSCIRFGDIPTAGAQITTDFNVRRNGENIQIQRVTGTDTLYVRVLVVGNNSS